MKPLEWLKIHAPADMRWRVEKVDGLRHPQWCWAAYRDGDLRATGDSYTKNGAYRAIRAHARYRIRQEAKVRGVQSG